LPSSKQNAGRRTEKKKSNIVAPRQMKFKVNKFKVCQHHDGFELHKLRIDPEKFISKRNKLYEVNDRIVAGKSNLNVNTRFHSTLRPAIHANK
jgi:hypothetical protein